MQSDGKKASYNPAATHASLLGKREKLQEELHNIEKQVYELETSYLQESSHFGNALKGFDGFLSASKNTTNLKRSRKFQPEDRIFSLFSVTSPAINFPWTLEEWLQFNQSKILETQVLPGPNIQCTQWHLTQEVRTIIGGILKSFKSIHEQFYVCGQLNTQNIMLSEGLDVKLTDVKLVRGNKALFKDDFSKLKEIIEKIIHNVAGNGNVPKDVLHFMSFLGKPMDRWVRNPIKREDVQKMVMSHPMGLSQFCCVTRFD